MSNHHLPYHKQNILSSQDGGPRCSLGRRGEVVSFCLCLPLPQPWHPTRTSCCLSAAAQTVFSRAALAPQEAQSPPRGCLSGPLLLPLRLTLIPLHTVLLRLLTRPCLPMSLAPLPAAHEPGALLGSVHLCYPQATPSTGETASYMNNSYLFVIIYNMGDDQSRIECLLCVCYCAGHVSYSPLNNPNR